MTVRGDSDLEYAKALHPHHFHIWGSSSQKIFQRSFLSHKTIEYGITSNSSNNFDVSQMKELLIHCFTYEWFPWDDLTR